MKFTKSWALQMLDLNPDWMAIAVDKVGSTYWYDYIPPNDGSVCWGKNTNSTTFLGLFTYDGHWKDTLVVRTCNYYIHMNSSAEERLIWKYCPKCGELLGSK